MDSRHLTAWIERPADEVYAYAVEPANLPEWAPGLGSEVDELGERWFVQTAEGRIEVAFAPRNEFGVLDHRVTLVSGEVIYVPLRVIADGADGSSSEVVFTLRRQEGMSDEDFARDEAAVAADLARLKEVLERRG